MLDYYAKRAPEYERIYTKPERQGDLAWLKARVRDVTRGARVLDLACGTGFWTEAMTDARSIVGADYNDTVLRIARGKGIAGASFVRADNDALPFAPGTFDVMTAGCWWSYCRCSICAGMSKGCTAPCGPACACCGSITSMCLARARPLPTTTNMAIRGSVAPCVTAASTTC
ncbi:methyltransferase domain-containing protein [Ralstonia sp. 1B3]